MSSICMECGKKLTCCKCGKLLCEPKAGSSQEANRTEAERSCRIIGYYKIREEQICADCYCL